MGFRRELQNARILFHLDRLKLTPNKLSTVSPEKLALMRTSDITNAQIAGAPPPHPRPQVQSLVEGGNTEAVVATLNLIEQEPRVAAIARLVHEGGRVEQVASHDKGSKGYLYMYAADDRLVCRVNGLDGTFEIPLTIPVKDIVSYEKAFPMGAQSREMISEYERMLETSEPPEIRVQNPQHLGGPFILLDGYHRYMAARNKKRETLKSWVQLGYDITDPVRVPCGNKEMEVNFATRFEQALK